MHIYVEEKLLIDSSISQVTENESATILIIKSKNGQNALLAASAKLNVFVF